MKSITAIYENGIFRPIGPVNLPEGCEVTVEPKVESAEQPQAADPQFAHLDRGLAEIYAILSHRYEGGSADAAARIDPGVHQRRPFQSGGI